MLELRMTEPMVGLSFCTERLRCHGAEFMVF